MTYDDWQSFLVSDLGKDLLKEFISRAEENREYIANCLQYPLHPDGLMTINPLIEKRNLYDGLVYEFQRGLFGFIDDEETDNV